MQSRLEPHAHGRGAHATRENTLSRQNDPIICALPSSDESPVKSDRFSFTLRPAMALYSIETHGELQSNLEREWLLTNGMGSFASSSIVGCNTRRYHSLLCAATIPPVGRMVTLSRIGEIIQRPNQPMLELSVNQFADRFHPRGDKYLRRFELDDTARYSFDAEGTKVTKEVLLFWERNTAAVRYTIEPHDFKPLQFSLLPFLAMRDFHALRAVATARFDVQ